MLCPLCKKELQRAYNYHEFASGWHTVWKCLDCHHHWSDHWDALREIPDKYIEYLSYLDDWLDNPKYCHYCGQKMEKILEYWEQDLSWHAIGECVICKRYWSFYWANGPIEVSQQNIEQLKEKFKGKS